MKSIFITLIGVAMGAGLMSWLYFQDQQRELLTPTTPEGRAQETLPSGVPLKSSPSEFESLESLPRTGRIEISLIARDVPSLKGTRFEVLVAPAFPREENRRLESLEQFQRTAVLEDGRGVVDGLLLNQKLTVELKPLPGTNRRKRWKLTEGPKTADLPATVEIDVTNSGPQCSISGRLLDSQAALLANQEFESLGTDFRGQPPIGFSPTTWRSNEEGRFLIVLQKADEISDLHIVLRRPGQADLRGHLQTIGWDLSKHEIGDLQLQEEQLLARGRVQNAQGEGLAGMTLSCAYRMVYSGGGEFGERSGSEMIATKEDGSFEFRGLTNSRTIRLSVFDDRYHVEGETFPVGNDAIVLEALELAQLRARCVLKDPPERQYPILLAYRQGAQDPKFLHPKNGLIEAKLAPGLYSFRLVYSGDKKKSVWERHDVEVAPGTTVELGDIGPPGDMIACALKLEFEGESLPDGTRVRLRIYDEAQGNPFKIEDLKVESRQLSIGVSQFPVTVDCLVRGQRLQQVTVEGPNASVVMSPGIPLRLTLSDINEVMSVKGLFQPVVLTSLFGGPDYLSARSELASSVFEILLPEPGTYSIGILGMTFNEKNEMTGYAVRATQTKVTVPESGLDRVVEVKVEEDVLEELRKRMIPRNWK